MVSISAFRSFMDESARWLLGTGRYAEARKVLQKVAHFRGDITAKQVDELVDNVILQDQKVKDCLAKFISTSKDIHNQSHMLIASTYCQYLLYFLSHEGV